MARDFSNKESKQLISRHRELLRQLGELQALPERFRREAAQTARKMQSARSFHAMVRSELLSGAVLSAADADKLTDSVIRYCRILPVAAYAKQMADYHQKDVEAQCRSLQEGGGGLRRIFASSQKKQEAESAYEALSALLTTSYPEKIERMTKDASDIQSTSAEADLRMLPMLREKLRDAAAEALKEVADSGGTVPEIAALLQRFDLMEQPFLQAQAAQEERKQQIKTAAQRVAAGDTLAILRGVPVEEVNRGKGGFRVKTLRDSGFENMADIYAAAPAQLAAVKGVSDEGAAELKRVAAGFAEQSAGTVKIRLSTDNRTPEATALVQAVDGYLRTADGISAYHAWQKEYGDSVGQSKEALRSVGNGVLWQFETPGRRREIGDAYRFLSGLTQGEGGARLRQLASQVQPQAPGTPEQAWSSFAQNTVRFYNVIEEVTPGLLGNDNAVYGLPEDLAHAIQAEPVDTEGLRCELRRYQEWGVKYILHQRRVLLGDEMGLGKTVQAIGAMVSLRNGGASRFAVVCPASVLTNWCREIAKHSDLSVISVHGSSRERALSQWLEEGGVAVTTYETTAHFDTPDDFRFDMMVVDEAHYIKNAEARRSVNVKKLCEKAERLLFMTGTAIENRVDEMIALMSVLQPEIAQRVRSMAFMSSAPQFREAVSPVYYRRRREDVLTELPELTDTPEWCKLEGEEEKIYEQAVLNRRYADARRVSWSVDSLEKSCKAKRLNELLEEAKAEDRKVIVFSFFLDTIQKISAMLGARCVGPINGSVSPQRRQELIDDFDKAPGGAVLTAQIQSGGTGLNIQSASVIILCEPQLKPSIENQAISRAYRMGQARNVLVYRLLCDDTVDEKIMDMLKEKQAVFDAFADKSAIGEETLELDQKTMSTIIDEEIKRINEKNDQNPQTHSEE